MAALRWMTEMDALIENKHLKGLEVEVIQQGYSGQYNNVRSFHHRPRVGFFCGWSKRTGLKLEEVLFSMAYASHDGHFCFSLSSNKVILVLFHLLNFFLLCSLQHFVLLFFSLQFVLSLWFIVDDFMYVLF